MGARVSTAHLNALRDCLISRQIHYVYSTGLACTDILFNNSRDEADADVYNR